MVKLVYVEVKLSKEQISDLITCVEEDRDYVVSFDKACFSGCMDANVTLAMTKKAADDFEFDKTSFVVVDKRNFRTMSKFQTKWSWDKILQIAARRKYKKKHILANES
jgi:hypothetical protein